MSKVNELQKSNSRGGIGVRRNSVFALDSEIVNPSIFQKKSLFEVTPSKVLSSSLSGMEVPAVFRRRLKTVLSSAQCGPTIPTLTGGGASPSPSMKKFRRAGAFEVTPEVQHGKRKRVHALALVSAGLMAVQSGVNGQPERLATSKYGTRCNAVNVFSKAGSNPATAKPLQGGLSYGIQGRGTGSCRGR